MIAESLHDRWQRLRQITWFRREQDEVMQYVEALRAEVNRLQLWIARLNALLERDDLADHAAEQERRKLAHEHAAATAERDDALAELAHRDQRIAELERQLELWRAGCAMNGVCVQTEAISRARKVTT